MVYFVWCKYCYPSFFVSLFPFSWNVFFLPPLFFSLCLSLLFFKILFIYFQRQGGRKEGEKHQCMIASCVPPTGDLARNPGMCPDWESNQQLFGSKARDQYTEPHEPRQYFVAFYDWIMFHGIDIPPFVYPFISWWTFELFPLTGYYE